MNYKFLLNNNYYLNILQEYSQYDLYWEKLKNKVIMLSGATGLVGRFLIDLIMYKNNNHNLNCKIVALVRNKKKAQEIFKIYKSKNLEIFEHDVKNEIKYAGDVNYIIHAASNTHPKLYSQDPIGTIETNFLGTYNLLKFGEIKNIEKFLFISSFEVYGKITENISKIKENDFGIIDCTELRSCYPESKRLSENLCIAFSNNKNIVVNIARLSRVFGPTMKLDSQLVISQIIKSCVNNENVVLKSDGSQKYSFNFVGDAVMAILLILIKGKNQEAYNVSNAKFDCELKEFANIAANYTNKEVMYDIPSESELKSYSNTIMTILDDKKIKELGYKVNYDIKTRIEQTINILKNE